MFKKSVFGAEYKFIILKYILYKAGFLTALIKPLIYRVKVHNINGGGIRGVVFFKVP